MTEAHFFDLDVLIKFHANVWMVEKTNPQDPIIKISQSEFNLIRKDIYKKFQCRLNLAGKDYWLPQNLYNTLKIRCSNKKINLTELSFSMQEFLDPEIIQGLDYTILESHFRHLKNSAGDLYIICSKSSKRAYLPIIEKLEAHLLELGVEVKNYYYISETFYNRDSDQICHKKVRLLLQHLMGKKTAGDKFIEEEITRYERIHFYDDDVSALELAREINSVLEVVLANSEADLERGIKTTLKENETQLVVNQITGNKVEPMFSEVITLRSSHLIRTFENYKTGY